MIVRFFAPLAMGVVAISLAASSCAQDATQPQEANSGKVAEAPADDIFDSIVDDEPQPATEHADSEAAEVAVTEDTGAEDTGADGPAITAAAVDGDEAQELFELRQRVAALETELEGLRETLNTLQQGLARIPNADELSNRALGAMAEDLPGTMGELMQGKVRLVNTTGQPVVMYVNGTAWTVVAGESYVLAPVGTVSFLYKADGEPVFKGVQEWQENRETGQYELEYRVDPSGSATEHSVLKPLPERN